MSRLLASDASETQSVVSAASLDTYGQRSSFDWVFWKFTTGWIREAP